ncbi:MAG TPA: hypothetical protein DEB39_03590 [Planctomycetaceae bacterium]|nr:hypothetical protein [Planctomycetaceae bacterium]
MACADTELFEVAVPGHRYDPLELESPVFVLPAVEKRTFEYVAGLEGAVEGVNFQLFVALEDTLLFRPITMESGAVFPVDLFEAEP